MRGGFQSANVSVVPEAEIHDDGGDRLLFES